MKRITTAAVTAAAFAGAGVAASLLRRQRIVERRRHLGGDVPFGSVRGERHTVVAQDGTELNVEVDEPDADGDDGLTIVFVHGWMCDQDTWHFQRLHLRGSARLVFVDQRGHGASGPTSGANSDLSHLADDLARVIAAHGKGRVVVVGHSMGGMATMQLAADFPELFGGTVVGVALVGTSAGKLVRGTPALERLAWFVRRSGPVLDWGRAFNSETVIRRWAVGPDADPQRAAMADEMISRAPSRVIADFYPNFPSLDLFDALSTLADVPVTVVCGTSDLLTPPKHSRRLAEAIDGARLVLVEGAGHMVMLEDPDDVSDAIDALVERVR
ncbi:alpha/beta fold hydrolase [Aeromicrobium sp. Leaf350]|uniref:alpha/beta fold hydrolase n=1 Tax=Aeromicrobium sp. Leaf350 TaxID=2876565 RepID=UPI001E6496D9|nr:alpha/beta hydrolase [Aeromicrobium sp. Leaf350]